MLMSDSHLNRAVGNPRLTTNMIVEEYLQYVDNQFPKVGTGVGSRQKGGSTVYTWETRSLPELSEFESWYATGEKVWPEVELTPIVLKHLYAGDGSYHGSGTSNHISIGMQNEMDNKEKIARMFENVGLPKPDRWDGHSIAWRVENSKDVLDYMGEPLPGFEYKWEITR